MISQGPLPSKLPLLELGLILAAILWLALAPLLAAGAQALYPHSLDESWHKIAFALAAGGVQIGGLLAAMALAKLVTGWDRLFTIALALALAAGCLLLANLSQIVLAPDNPYLVNPLAGLLQLLLGIPYLLLAGGLLAGRLRQQKLRAVWQEMGLTRTGSLGWGLGAAGLALGAWLVVGSLGDAGQSGAILIQALATGLLTEWLWRGLIYLLLLTIIPIRWVAILFGAALYLVYASTAGFSQGIINGLGQPLVALPLTLVVTGLWLRPGQGREGIWGAVAFHTLYLAMPRLLVDPRLVGIKVSHSLVALAALFITLGLGLLLLGSQLFFSYRGKRPQPSQARAAAIAAAPWALALVAYLMWGVFGFANDGYLIILEEQADLTAVDQHDLYSTLVQTAERSQADIRAELDRLKLSYRPYYLANMIRVEGSTRGMRDLAKWPKVREVLLNPNVRRSAFHQVEPYAPGDPSDLPWGLDSLEADQVWELGIAGRGVVVGGQDTGYEWDHPELRNNYRGWDGQNVDHDYNWHDAWDHRPAAFDDQNHGTHTMGTAVGSTVGMAPEAQWIGCRSMRYGIGNPGAYIECMEFFFAPYPLGGDPFHDGDPSLAPHVVNNSWGCPPEEGCIGPEPIHTAVEVMRAAGIMMVTSAGNDGPSCGTIWAPANEEAVFSVGASDELEQVVYFSSRGPAKGGFVKPDVLAPGLGVVSSTANGRYGLAGGTSMASPHVVGLIALMWSANPELLGNIDLTEALITQTAEPREIQRLCSTENEGQCACGQHEPNQVPNNVYGYGLVEALTVVQAALELEGSDE